MDTLDADFADELEAFWAAQKDELRKRKPKGGKGGAVVMDVDASEIPVEGG